MPAGYEKMRDKFIADGMDKDEAQEKAARIWNAKHPNNPVTRKHEEGQDVEPSKIMLDDKILDVDEEILNDD